MLPTALSSAASADVPVFTQRTMVGSDLFVTDEATDFWINAIAPADVDKDGDLDLAVIGFYVVYNESVEDILVVFKNEGSDGAGGWQFTEERVPLDDVFAGGSDLAWGDFDADGDQDLAVGSEGATVAVPQRRRHADPAGHDDRAPRVQRGLRLHGRLRPAVADLGRRRQRRRPRPPRPVASSSRTSGPTTSCATTVRATAAGRSPTPGPTSTRPRTPRAPGPTTTATRTSTCSWPTSTRSASSGS